MLISVIAVSLNCSALSGCITVIRTVNQFRSQRQITYLLTCVPNEYSDQPAHSRSDQSLLVRIVQFYILGYPKCTQLDFLIRLRETAGANVQRYVFSRFGSNVFQSCHEKRRLRGMFE